MRRENDEHEEHGGSVDEALRAYLASELDPQCGRARRAFERHLAATARTGRRGPGSRSHTMPAWVVGAVGTGLAASVAALVWAVPSLRESEHPTIVQPFPIDATTLPAGPHDPALRLASTSSWEQTSHEVSSIYIPADTLVFEGATPARVVRQLQMERTQWTDERRGVRVEAVVPRQSVRLIALDTY
jgi:hypothetical protein